MKLSFLILIGHLYWSVAADMKRQKKTTAIIKNMRALIGLKEHSLLFESVLGCSHGNFRLPRQKGPYSKKCADGNGGGCDKIETLCKP